MTEIFPPRLERCGIEGVVRVGIDDQLDRTAGAGAARHHAQARRGARPVVQFADQDQGRDRHGARRAGGIECDRRLDHVFGLVLEQDEIAFADDLQRCDAALRETQDGDPARVDKGLTRQIAKPP